MLFAAVVNKRKEFLIISIILSSLLFAVCNRATVSGVEENRLIFILVLALQDVLTPRNDQDISASYTRAP